jgi:hypothetical protein
MPIEKTNAAARVRRAQARVDTARRDLTQSVAPWRAQIARHRGAIIVLGGFAGGVAATAVPRRWWARFASLVGALAAGAVRTAMLPALLGANRDSQRDVSRSG